MSRIPTDDPREPSHVVDKSIRVSETPPQDSLNWGQEPGGHAADGPSAPVNSASKLFENPHETVGGPDTGQDEHDDSAIREYMAALLARTQGPDSERHDARTAVTSSPPRPSPADSAATESGEPPASTQSRQEQPAQERRRHVRPPECRNAISELRAVANIDARSNLDLHRAKQIQIAMNDKLVVTLVALVVSFSLLAVTEHKESVPFYSAVIASIAAMCWAAKYFRLGHQLKQICFAREEDEEPTESIPR